MKVLYIGGTGQISFDCVHESVKAGHDTWVFNRGNSNDGLPPETRFLIGDMHDDDAYRQIVDEGFDVICQFRVFDVDAMERDLRFFTGHCKQYVFISSASAYHKPVGAFPITEDVPLHNPFWEYSRKKAACEERLAGQSDLPWTIVRPSHTSRDKLTTAMGEGDLAARRMLAGKPIVVPGDGTSLWTITHSRDFAPPFVKLLSNDRALGEAFHLTSDHAYPFDMIYAEIGRALGVEAELVHVPSETLIRYHPGWEGALLGDKTYTVMFDNRKIKGVVGDFDCPTTLEGFMRDVVAASRERIDGPGGGGEGKMDALFDQIINDQRALGG